ncbi:hypothetical protein [Streptomyces sp. NPDC050659]|uniref:hypothetical protein n=1 Tax=Streptomyces sp. NPDC050659 TaxID=3157215 RepID=UPI00342FF340
MCRGLPDVYTSGGLSVARPGVGPIRVRGPARTAQLPFFYDMFGEGRVPLRAAAGASFVKGPAIL